MTPIGRYVSRLHRADKKLANRPHPGTFATDPRTREIALQHLADTHALQGTLRDEMARFGALPLGPVDPTREGYDDGGYPFDYDGPEPTFTAEEMDALDGEPCCL